MTAQGPCSHAGCTCTVREPHGVLRRGRAYCSDGCAAGQGCGHGGCNCGPRDSTPTGSD
ncbi:MAG TPA: metallothionein [Gammaproteobacteria bacterium]